MGKIRDYADYVRNKEAIRQDRDNTYGQTSYQGNTPFGQSQYDEGVSVRNIEEGQLDDIRGERQGAWSQAGNALLGFVGMTASHVVNTIPTLLGAAIGTGMEVGDLFTDGNTSNFMDYVNNPVSRKLSEFNDKIREELPIYKTQETEDAGWSAPLHAGFLFDLAREGGAFALSAYLTGGVTSGLINKTGTIAKAIVGAENGLIAESVLGTISGATKPGAINAIKDFAGKAVKQMGAGFIGAVSEAGIEATQNRDNIRGKLLEEAKAKKLQQTNGESEELTEEEMLDIEDRSNSSGNAVFLANLAILSLSNVTQFSKYYNNYTDDAVEVASKLRGESTAGLAKTYATKELDEANKWYSKLFGETTGKVLAKTGKIYDKTKEFAKDTITEGIEEATQLGIERTMENYFGNDKSTMGNAVESLSNAMFGLYDKEGIQSFLGGMLIGGGSAGIGKVFGAKTPSEQEKVNKSIADLSTINLSKSVKDIADNLARTKYTNDLKTAAAMNGDEVAYQIFNNVQFAGDVVTAVRNGKLDDLLDGIDSFSDSSLEDVKEMMKIDLTLDDDTSDRTADSIGKIDRKALASEMKNRAKNIAKNYQEIKRKYGHIYDEKELEIISNINANQDLIIKDRNNLIEQMKSKGFDYVDKIQSKIATPTSIQDLELRKETINKKLIDKQNEIGKTFGQLQESDRKVNAGFIAMNSELTDIKNEQNDLLKEIDATILINENPQDNQDFSGRVNKAYNNFINNSEFEKKREAGTPLEIKEVGKAINKLKKYNDILTQYTNLYNKLTGTKGKEEIKDFQKRIAKLKEQKAIRNMFTTSMRDKNGKTITNEIKNGLYYRKIGKRYQTKKSTPEKPIWAGGGKQFIEVVDRKIGKDNNGNVKPIITVKNSNGELIDYDLVDFKNLIKVAFTNKEGESVEDFLTDEERFYAKHKGDLIKYRYKEEQGKPAKDIYGYLVMNEGGELQVMYFDEITGQKKYTKKLNYKYKVGKDVKKATTDAFVVQVDNADYSQYLEILSKEDSEKYLTKIVLKIEDTDLKDKIQKSIASKKAFNMSNFVDYVIESEQSKYVNKVMDTILELEQELQVAIDNNLPQELIDTVRNLIIENANVLNENNLFVETLTDINKIYTERLAMLERQANILEEQINNIDNVEIPTQAELDNLNSYKKELNNTKAVMLRMLSKRKDNVLKAASDDIITKHLDILSKYENVIDSMFQYNDVSELVTLSAIQAGYVSPETIDSLENQSLSPKQKAAIIKYGILQGFDVASILNIELEAVDSIDKIDSLSTALGNTIAVINDYKENKGELDANFVSRMSEALQRRLNQEESKNILNYDKSELDETAILEQERKTLNQLFKDTTTNYAEKYELEKGQYQAAIRGNDPFTHGVNIKPSDETDLPDASVVNSGIKSIMPSGINDTDFDSMSVADKHNFVFNKFMQDYKPNADDRLIYSIGDVVVEGMNTLPYYNNSNNPADKTIRMTLRNKNGEVVRVDSNGKRNKNGKYTVTTTLAAATDTTESGKFRFRQQIELNNLKVQLQSTQEGTEKHANLLIDINRLETMINLRTQELLDFRKDVIKQLENGNMIESPILSKSNGILRSDGKSRNLGEVLNMTDEQVIKAIQTGKINLFTAKTNTFTLNGITHKVKIGRAYVAYDNKLYFLNVNKISNFDSDEIVKGLAMVLKGTATFNEVLKKELSPIYWGRGQKKTTKEKDTAVTEFDEFSDELVDEIRAKTYHIFAQEDKIIYGNLVELDPLIKKEIYGNSKERVYEQRELTLSDIQNQTEAYQDFKDFISDKYYNVNNSLLQGKNISKSYVRKLVMNGLRANIRPNNKIQFDSIYVRPNADYKVTTVKNKSTTTPTTAKVASGVDVKGKTASSASTNKSTAVKFSKEDFVERGLDIKVQSFNTETKTNFDKQSFDVLFPTGIENATPSDIDSILTQVDEEKGIGEGMSIFIDDISKSSSEYKNSELEEFLRDLKAFKEKPQVQKTSSNTGTVDFKDAVAVQTIINRDYDAIEQSNDINDLEALLKQYISIRDSRNDDDNVKTTDIDRASGKSLPSIITKLRTQIDRVKKQGVKSVEKEGEPLEEVKEELILDSLAKLKANNLSNRAVYANLIIFLNNNPDVDYQAVQDIINANTDVSNLMNELESLVDTGATMMLKSSINRNELQGINDIVTFNKWYQANKNDNISDKELVEYYKQCKQ